LTEHALHPTAGPDTRSTPLISVVMPVRGRPYTLAKTVESILNQTFEEFEFIVVLDGFDLETEQILAKIQDPRLRIVISPENVGIPKALNLGLRNARGKYFARMDNGDFAEPYRLKDHLDSVANGAQVSFCQAAIVEPDGAIIEETVNQPWLLRIWSSMFCQSLGTAGSALFAEVELLRSTGGFDETYRFAQDYEISERLASQGKEFAYRQTTRRTIRLARPVSAGGGSGSDAGSPSSTFSCQSILDL
jgi:glycosyltransferase involved in cell wall biosynthesis